MKKLILITACLGLMALVSAGGAEAYSQTGLTTEWNSGETAYMQFNIPPVLNTFSSYWLKISADTHGYSNDIVKINGIDVGTLSASFAGALLTTRLNVNNFFASYVPNGQPLNVSIYCDGALSMYLSMDQPDLLPTLECTNYGSIVDQPNGNTAPVPEPATLLLLGSGLSGLAFWGKRRRVAA